MRLALLAAIAATFLSAHAATAGSVRVGDLELTGLWTRATPPRAESAGGYLTVANHGAAPDRLVAVRSPEADRVEIHEMKVEDGIMTMRPLAGGIAVPAGATVTLAPGGYHLMFLGLRAPFEKGGEVPVALTFENAGTVETALHVEAIGAPGPDGHGHEQGADQ